jgi:DNA polymerase III delta subunit
LDTDQTNEVNAETNESFVDYFMKNPNISQDVLLIFVSYSPDKRSKLFKYLSENVNVKKFDKLSGTKLKEFILEFLPGLKFADEALDYFTFKV